METPAPLISLCVPAYNRPDGLRRALRSILAAAVGQPHDRIEIVVSDDSTDPAVEQAARQELARWKGPWTYRANRPRLGMAENWNASARLGAGGYLWILHDDDYLLPRGLAGVLNAIRGGGAPVLLFGVALVDENGNTLRTQAVGKPERLAPREAVRRLLADSSFVRFPGLVMSRAAFAESGGFDPAWKEPADLDLWLRLAERHGLALEPAVTAAYTVHPQALTMGMFHAGTVALLLRLFDRTAAKGLLAPRELEACRRAFFHQFVLAGAYRKMRQGDWAGFRSIVGLLAGPGLAGLRAPPRWLPLKGAFLLLANAKALLAAAAIAAAALLMPTRESLWMDEVATLRFVSGESFHGLLGRLAASTDSLAQMPLGVLAAWGWVRLGAASEWALRALNCLWMLAGAAGLFLAGRRLRLPTLPLWFAVQPFLWFYANEFRPYALQVAGSAWVLHGLVACLQDRGRGSAWAWSLALGGFVMTGATLLGAIPLALAAALAAGALLSRRAWPDRRAWLPLGLGLLLLLPLGLHHAATLARGAGGARVWEPGLLNPVFAGYELLGFLGLGPARLEIREAARAGAPALLALFKVSLPALGLLGLLYLALLLPLRKRIEDDRNRVMLAVALLAAAPPLLLLIAARLAGWPFWGRHLSPVLPFTACLTAWLADRFTSAYGTRRLARLVPALLALLLLASALSLRFSPRHRKDDYRKAAALAGQAAERGETVWWSADLDTALYYGVAFNRTRDGGGIVYPVTRFDSATGAYADPALVITSKPDLYDREGKLTLWLEMRQYRARETFPGFTLWRRP